MKMVIAACVMSACLSFGTQPSANSADSFEKIIPEKIVIHILTSKRMMHFYHPEDPNSKSLVVSENLIKPIPNLKIFGKPVIFRPDSLVTWRFIRFTKFIRQDSILSIDVKIPLEGVHGRFQFRSEKSDSYTLLSESVVEN